MLSAPPRCAAARRQRIGPCPGWHGLPWIPFFSSWWPARWAELAGLDGVNDPGVLGHSCRASPSRALTHPGHAIPLALARILHRHSLPLTLSLSHCLCYTRSLSHTYTHSPTHALLCHCDTTTVIRLGPSTSTLPFGVCVIESCISSTTSKCATVVILYYRRRLDPLSPLHRSPPSLSLPSTTYTPHRIHIHLHTSHPSEQPDSRQTPASQLASYRAPSQTWTGHAI